jgi:CDP-diacylglycerol--glycerol-3-phosphate 3-phosphatidyltransferase
MLRRIWTISNALSFSRVVLLAPLAYCLFSEIPHRSEWVAAIIFVAGLTDFFDGYLARRLHQVTDLGKIIDPLADKICAGGAAVLFVTVGALPLWYLMVVVARDVLILIGGIYIKAKKNIVTQSNWPGKVAVFLIALVMLLTGLALPSLERLQQLMIWSSVFMMAVSFAIYVQRLFVGNVVGKRSVR